MTDQHLDSPTADADGYLSHRQILVVMGGLMAGMFLAALDQSIVGTALPRITASIGVSSYREHLAPGGTQRRRESTFLRLADSAMYRAKAAGRNRVEVADPED